MGPRLEIVPTSSNFIWIVSLHVRRSLGFLIMLLFFHFIFFGSFFDLPQKQQQAKVSREEATKIARTWEDSGLFRCVTSDTRQFRDDSAFFRFLVPRGLMDESPNVGRRGSRRESEDFGEGLRKIGGGPHLPQKRANSFSSMSTPLLLSPTLSPPNFSSSYSLPPENPSPRANSYDPNRLIGIITFFTKISNHYHPTSTIKHLFLFSQTPHSVLLLNQKPPPLLLTICSTKLTPTCLMSSKNESTKMLTWHQAVG